jgi:hypothetical protein
MRWIMYDEQDHIETAKDGFGFGHGGAYKYRVMDRMNIGATHHTNDLEDARRWFRKCRAYWLEQEAVEQES